MTATTAIIFLAGLGALCALCAVIFFLWAAVAASREVSGAEARRTLAAARVRKLATDIKPHDTMEWVQLNGQGYLRLPCPAPGPGHGFPWAAVLVAMQHYREGRLTLDNTLQEGWDGEIRKLDKTVAMKGELVSMGRVSVDVDDDWRRRVAESVNEWLDRPYAPGRSSGWCKTGGRAMTDAEKLRALDDALGLHERVEIDYMVDGYEASLVIHNGATVHRTAKGETIMGALLALSTLLEAATDE